LATFVGLLGGCGGDTATSDSDSAASTGAQGSTSTNNTSTTSPTTSGSVSESATGTSGGGNSATDGDPTTTTATTDPSGTTGPGTSATTGPGTSTDPGTTSGSTGPGPNCGDGKVDPDEECDGGEANNDNAICTTNCTNAVCGDGKIYNTGDGVEECDDGDNGPGKACNAECKPNVCGDGDVGPDEQCDDGNAVNSDSCVDGCKIAFCGDGFVGPGEACDDGNQVDDDDCTNACVVGLPGSCRPSEIFGASGGFPAFTDPAYKNFLDKKVAVMTSNNQGDGWVLHVIDISGPPPPPNLNYNAPKYHNAAWQQGSIGRVFGLTLDSGGNIYVAPTTVYGANAAPATIKKIDRLTGAVSNFATLPNNGPAFGNINYDCVSETIYVSNHEDGRVYQIDMGGKVVSTYRHSDKNVTLGLPNDVGEPNGQFIPLGQRVWAVQSHAGRLYYSVWTEDAGRKDAVNSNAIWSVGYKDKSGVIDPATAKLEFLAPAYNGQNYSNPVSDLSFAATGWMLISQRTMISDTQTSAHQSTTYEYQYMNGTWVLKGTTYLVGELVGSAAGGVDHDFDKDGYVWMTGDALDFYTPNVVYGLQGTPHGGGDITNSTLIDLDGEITQQDKTAMGDVELPIPGDAMPVPEPQ
jgi:cysteine-rich repeat protein